MKLYANYIVKQNIRIFCIGIILISCSKKVKVSGTITNSVDGSLIEGVKLDLVEWKKRLLDYERNGIVAISTSDANGLYQFNSKLKKKYSFSIELHDRIQNPNSPAVDDTTSDVYERYSWPIETDNRVNVTGDVQKIDIRLIPLGRLKIIAKNINSVSDSDRIEVYLTSNQLVPYNNQLLFSYNFGAPVSGYQFVPTNGTVALKWSASKIGIPGFQSVGSATIALTQFRKTAYQIEY